MGLIWLRSSSGRLWSELVDIHPCVESGIILHFPVWAGFGAWDAL